MKWIIGIILFLILFVWINISYTEEYNIVGKIIDKGMTTDKYGIVNYHTLVLYDDGSTKDIKGIDDYIRLEKGVRYTFTKSRLNFHKK